MAETAMTEQLIYTDSGRPSSVAAADQDIQNAFIAAISVLFQEA